MKNIVKDYKWTTVTGEAYLRETPRIRARSYVIDNNEIFNSVANWGKTLLNFTGDYRKYYNDLHKANLYETWVFPYFGDEVRQFSNEWGDQLVTSTTGAKAYGSDLGEGIKAGAEQVLTTKGVLEGAFRSLWGGDESKAAGSLFEPPKFYQYSANDSAFALEFTLINTESNEDIDKNYELVKKLITINRFTRVGGLATNPPQLWDVLVPGFRYIRWASCDVSVNLIGRRIYYINRLIPEGYRVTLSFKSLYTEPSNYMNDVLVDF